MLWLNVVIALFGLMNIGLGVEAYAAKGSIFSLLGGGIAGILLLASLPVTKWQPRVGRTIALIVCLALLGKFLPTYIKKGGIYPAGLMSVTSLVVACCLIGAHIYAISRKRRLGL